MRWAAILPFVFALSPAALPAQTPKDGDLVLSMLAHPDLDAGAVLVVDPNTGAISQLASTSGGFHNWVRMASNNTDLVAPIVRLAGGFRTDLVEIDPSGGVTTLATISSASVDALALDHDGLFILAGGRSATGARVWSMDGAGNVVNLFSSTGAVAYQGIAIDRDNDAWPYALAAFDPSFQTHQIETRVLGADRSGKVKDIFQSGATGTGDPLTFLSGLEINPGTGQYLSTALIVNQNVDSVSRVSKYGMVEDLLTIRRANGAKLAQDGTAWVIGDNNTSLAVFQVDPGTGSVLETVPLTGFHSQDFRITGVEVYGSRRLVCRQSGSNVCIDIQSRKIADANKPYELFWSLARRPGEVQANGERLDLNQNTRVQLATGVTDGSGDASVNVSTGSFGLPSGTTVFVAARIEDGIGNVQTVTNTHWFVIP